ncbi:MAG TPA: amidohydrolase family protein [Stellaceae bacterium]|jgi:hypothetical protein|nr:amidohydrolase family protein [Stellaceae bacterium]
MPSPHRIDVHHHFVPQIYKDALSALGSACPAPGYQPPIAKWTEQHSLDQMDAAEIAAALVSVTTPGIHFGNDAAAGKLARQCNDAGAKMVQDKPTRFGLFAALPLPDVDASLKEIAYALDQLKADGIGVYTDYESSGANFWAIKNSRPSSKSSTAARRSSSSIRPHVFAAAICNPTSRTRSSNTAPTRRAPSPASSSAARRHAIPTSATSSATPAGRCLI